MEDRFSHIDINNEKINRIINSAFEEFSKNSFEKASTNVIVKDAGISRGLLYHYFKDKKDLFDFLVYFSMKMTAENMEKNIDWQETDFLGRIRQGLAASWELNLIYPYWIDFYSQISDAKELKKIRDIYEKYYPGLKNKIYRHNIDFSKIKEGVDIEKMINVVKFTLRGIGKKYWEETRSKGLELDIDVCIKESDEYIEFFRNLFYK